MTRQIRVAIVGAGPAGIYAGDILRRKAAEHGLEVSIDLFESLPSPYGLIRYGVAPDHPRIKGIVTSLHEMLDDGQIRLLGNVEVGADITVDELRGYFHAVIFATGAQRDVASEIPGSSLAGSFGAADFVSWYDGHPDVPRDWALDATEIAVLGNGNVALDVARVLAKHPHDILSTDIPENVHRGLLASPVRDVHVFGRRGPADIKFTPIELRELGEVDGVDIVLDDADFEVVEPTGQTRAAGNQAKVMARILASWRDREPTGAPRRLHLHFWHKPVEIVGDGRVQAIRFERTEPDGNGGIRGTGRFLEYEVQSVYRAIGYHGSPVRDLPFDESAGVIPNVGGRVVQADGTPAAGLYATGWIKRGPVGLIGHTKSDATETIENLIADADALLDGPRPAADGVTDFLSDRGVQYTTWQGWLTLNAHEVGLGADFDGPITRERIKVVSREDQVAISNSEVLAL